MRITNKIYTFADATEFGYAPDERCDWCGGKFTKRPTRHETYAGWYSVCCTDECSDKIWATPKESFRNRFTELVAEVGYGKARKALLHSRQSRIAPGEQAKEGE